MVAVMMTCVMIAVIQLLWRIDNGLQLTYLPWLGFHVAGGDIYHSSESQAFLLQ
jgi:hypothetical protein